MGFNLFFQYHPCPCKVRFRGSVCNSKHIGNFLMRVTICNVQVKNSPVPVWQFLYNLYQELHAYFLGLNLYVGLLGEIFAYQVKNPCGSVLLQYVVYHQSFCPALKRTLKTVLRYLLKEQYKTVLQVIFGICPASAVLKAYHKQLWGQQAI